MEKRGVRLLVALVVLIALAHAAIHFAVYGTGISGLGEKGISGFSVGKFKVGEELKESAPVTSSTSYLFLFMEWGIILVLFVTAYAKHKFALKKEYADLKLRKNIKLKGKKTELDKFYKFLKEKKHLNISTVAKAFSVKENIVKNWAKTLESGGLAEITYPRIGGPKVILKES